MRRKITKKQTGHSHLSSQVCSVRCQSRAQQAALLLNDVNKSLPTLSCYFKRYPAPLPLHTAQPASATSTSSTDATNAMSCFPMTTPRANTEEAVRRKTDATCVTGPPRGHPGGIGGPGSPSRRVRIDSPTEKMGATDARHVCHEVRQHAAGSDSGPRRHRATGRVNR